MPMIRPPWRRGPAPRRVHAGEGEVERHATWLELFFDLVFVVAVARLGAVLHHDHDFGGFLTYAGLFVPIWWAWISYSYFADLFDEDRTLDRLAQFAAMLGAAVVAVALSEGVTEDSNLFAGAFVAMFALLALLYAHACRTEPAARELCRWYVVGSTTGAALWLASLAVPSPGRYWLWAAAVTANALISGPIAYARTTSPPRQVSHMPERFGLFAIVMLGEGILAVVNGIEAAHWDAAAVVTAVAGFVIASSIWWTYFSDFDEATIDRAIASGRAAQVRAFLYGYGHLVVYIGIAASGVGVQVAIESSNRGSGPGLLLPATLALVVAGFVVMGAGTGALRLTWQLAVKAGVLATGVLASLVLEEVAAATVVVALGWVLMAVLKSLYVRAHGPGGSMMEFAVPADSPGAADPEPTEPVGTLASVGTGGAAGPRPASGSSAPPD
jgi:low temperature requirement protein LtrA